MYLVEIRRFCWKFLLAGKTDIARVKGVGNWNFTLKQFFKTLSEAKGASFELKHCGVCLGLHLTLFRF